MKGCCWLKSPQKLGCIQHLLGWELTQHRHPVLSILGLCGAHPSDYRPNLKHQIFYSNDSTAVILLSSGEHLAVSGDISGCHVWWKNGLIPASSGQRLNSLQCPSWPSTKKNYPAQSVKSAKLSSPTPIPLEQLLLKCINLLHQGKVCPKSSVYSYYNYILCTHNYVLYSIR